MCVGACLCLIFVSDSDDFVWADRLSFSSSYTSKSSYSILYCRQSQCQTQLRFESKFSATFAAAFGERIQRKFKTFILNF